MLEMKRKRWIYTDEPTGARFRLTKEELHNHSVPIRPAHIYIVDNPKKIPTKDLKNSIIDQWFRVENEMYKRTKK
jgi:hypothetical protein